MVDEKNNQKNSEKLKRKHEKEGKQRIDDTMLGFQADILPAANGCHPNITIGPRSNKIDRFNGYNPLQLENNQGDDDDVDDVDNIDDVDDDEYVDKASAEVKRVPYEIGVDEDGTRRYKTADGKKVISYRKNAPQNGKY